MRQHLVGLSSVPQALPQRSRHLGSAGPLLLVWRALQAPNAIRAESICARPRPDLTTALPLVAEVEGGGLSGGGP